MEKRWGSPNAGNQTFQLESPANLAITKSTGKTKPWRLYLKPVDVTNHTEHSLIPGLQFSSLPGKECRLKTVLHMCKDGQPGRTWHYRVLSSQSWVELSLSKPDSEHKTYFTFGSLFCQSG